MNEKIKNTQDKLKEFGYFLSGVGVVLDNSIFN